MQSIVIGQGEDAVEAEICLVQGGMGVWISGPGLATAVANEGGIGVIATPAIGKNLPNFRSKIQNAVNIEALRGAIRKARSKTKGVLGVNILVAQSNYPDMVLTAIEEEIDIIFSGGGPPLELPLLAGDTKTKLVPIITTRAKTICRKWLHDAGRLPDAIVVEGPMAGGHIGAYPSEKYPDPKDNPEYELGRLVENAVREVAPFEEQYGVKIPIIAAGGIYTGADIAWILSKGAAGVQMGTRFVTTIECDASFPFKQAYLDSREEDIVIIKSPVGMPGRAIRNRFLELVEDEEEENPKKKPTKCAYKCIRTCEWRKSPYCIFEALISAAEGDLDNGFAFAGVNAYRATEIISVHELIETLKTEYEAA